MERKPFEAYEEAEFQGEVLVAIMNNPLDFVIARDQHWYRIPVQSVDKFLKSRWPPQWLAFYQTKVFGSEAFAVKYYARILDIHQVFRWQLFPDEPRDSRSEKCYYQLFLSPLQELSHPILSRRRRRIVFIPTTWRKFKDAIEINDLYDESPLEDRLWAELRRREIVAERQYFIQVQDQIYALDFAIFCGRSNIDVETDGDRWHADPVRIPMDNQRDNDLVGLGWAILRFNSQQVQESMLEYCIPAIIENINRRGGLVSEGEFAWKLDPDAPAGARQLTLFEAEPEYEVA